jgi:hypothetical protein
VSESPPSIRERILDSAFGAFMRHGYGGTSTAQIARHRGLLNGAEPVEMAGLFLAVLMNGGVLVRLLMRVAAAPDETDATRRAEAAAGCLLRLYGATG